MRYFNFISHTFWNFLNHNNYKLGRSFSCSCEMGLIKISKVEVEKLKDLLFIIWFIRTRVSNNINALARAARISRINFEQKKFNVNVTIERKCYDIFEQEQLRNKTFSKVFPGHFTLSLTLFLSYFQCLSLCRTPLSVSLLYCLTFSLCVSLLFSVTEWMSR